MRLARFRVEFAQAASPRTIQREGESQALTINGVSFRAVPVALPGQGELAGWYANTPNGQIGLSVFGEGSERFVKGFEFDMVVEPDPIQPQKRGFMGIHVVIIPEVGQFKPSILAISKGDTVVWVALGSVPRGVVSKDGSVKSPMLSAREGKEVQSFAHVFDQAGTFTTFDPVAPRLTQTIHVA